MYPSKYFIEISTQRHYAASKVGTFDTAAKDVWYGSEEVVDLWLGALL